VDVMGLIVTALREGGLWLGVDGCGFEIRRRSVVDGVILQGVPDETQRVMGYGRTV